MTSKNFAIAVATLVLIMPAFADNAAPDGKGGRYTFNKVDDGFMRLDTQTGEVALCNRRAVGWACLMAPEDRAALENEITRLRGENGALKKDILSHGLPLPPGVIPGASDARNDALTQRLPGNTDVDRAVAYVGRMWHRLVEAIANAGKQVLNKAERHGLS
jgi:hypothetical protein